MLFGHIIYLNVLAQFTWVLIQLRSLIPGRILDTLYRHIIAYAHSLLIFVIHYLPADEFSDTTMTLDIIPLVVVVCDAHLARVIDELLGWCTAKGLDRDIWLLLNPVLILVRP